MIFQLHAEYDRESDDYNAHRVVQAFDTAQFVRSTRSDACVQVLAADLNTQPGDLAHRLLLMTSGLRETYNEKEHEDYYGTNECAHNSYTPPGKYRIFFIHFEKLKCITPNCILQQ